MPAPSALRTDDRAIDMGPLPGYVGYQLRRAHILMFQSFAAHMAASGLTPGQFGVLTVIRTNPGINQTELGLAIGIDRSTVVAVIDRLQARGLVVRGSSPKDRRSYALRLSDAGESLMRDSTDAVTRHEHELTHRLTDAERNSLLALLVKMCAA